MIDDDVVTLDGPLPGHLRKRQRISASQEFSAKVICQNDPEISNDLTKTVSVASLDLSADADVSPDPCESSFRIDGIIFEEGHSSGRSLYTPSSLKQRIYTFASEHLKQLGTYDGSAITDFVLSSRVESLHVTSGQDDGLDQVRLFSVHDEPPECGYLESEEGGCTEQTLPIWTQYRLPHRSLMGKWDSLYLKNEVKRTLMVNAKTAISLSHYEVDRNYIAWNKLCLIHGPPGTGKTSICKALANELAATFYDRHPRFYLLEINSHSIFSKFFSESGKQVLGIFTQIKDILKSDDNPFVIVLIDEVESLSSARSMAMNRNEPSDAVRVVNAMLTQIDSLQSYPNCMVLSTTNMLNAIDEAFLDRVDFKILVGAPDESQRLRLLHGMVDHLLRIGVVQSVTNRPASHTVLEHLARCSQGITGRTLKKLPFKALVNARLGHEGINSVSFDDFCGHLGDLLSQHMTVQNEDDKQ